MLPNNKIYFWRGIKLILVFTLLFQSGCHIYKLDVRQGNELEQTKLNLLKPRQSKQEVQKILGSAIVDPINSNRLDYYFSLRPNGDQITKKQHITLIFDKNDKLNHYISHDSDLYLRHLPKKATNISNEQVQEDE